MLSRRRNQILHNFRFDRINVLFKELEYGSYLRSTDSVAEFRVTLLALNSAHFYFDINGGDAKNDGHENDGPSKLQGMKLQDMTRIDSILFNFSFFLVL